MKEKILLVLLILALCLSTCQTEYYPAASYSSMYGGDVLYEIAFETVGNKKLMGSYARLRRI